MKAFVRATWLLDDWNLLLLPEEVDVRLEFADFPFLTGRALADRMHGEEVFITNEDRLNKESMDGNSNLKIIGVLDNVIVSPHIASYTREAHASCDRIVQEDVIRFARGERMRFLANP